MKKIVAIFILLSFSIAAPVRAGMIMEYDSMDKDQKQKKQLEDDMSRDFKKQLQEPDKPKSEESGSSWWKWALGIVVVGGIAVAAGGSGGGGGGGGSSTSTPGPTGTITGTW